jgi:hypothetical protein
LENLPAEPQADSASPSSRPEAYGVKHKQQYIRCMHTSYMCVFKGTLRDVREHLVEVRDLGAVRVKALEEGVPLIVLLAKSCSNACGKRYATQQKTTQNTRSSNTRMQEHAVQHSNDTDITRATYKNLQIRACMQCILWARS